VCPRVDSGSLFRFLHRCRIGDFWTFVSISHTINGRLVPYKTAEEDDKRAAVEKSLLDTYISDMKVLPVCSRRRMRSDRSLGCRPCRSGNNRSLPKQRQPTYTLYIQGTI